jgi:DNA-binding Lrp family transcriptional regulator
MTLELDRIDRAILGCLQENGRISNQELAERVNLSPAPCWRRVRRLEEQGLIDRYVALLNRDRLGLGVTAYVHITLTDHHAKTLDGLDAFLSRSPEVLECYSVSGEYDYLIKVIAPGIAEVEEFLMHRLLREKAVNTTSTTFVLREKKHTTAVPLQA